MALAPLSLKDPTTQVFRFPETENEAWELTQATALTTFAGLEYQRLNYESQLHELLRTKLCDISWADAVWEQYKTHLLPLLKGSPLQKELQEWLELNCFNLGCARLPFISEKRTQLPAHLHAAWDQFIAHISCLEHSHEGPPKTHKVLMVSHSMGEKRVHDAMLDHLRKQGNPVVDENPDVVMEKKDPFYIFNGRITIRQVYEHYFVKLNARSQAENLWYCCATVKKFIPDDTIAALVVKIRELNPTLILTTRWDQPSEAALAVRLNIPMKVIHCDYGFTTVFGPGFKNNPLVQFWVPSLTIRGLPPEGSPTQIQVLGYPLRVEIQKVTDVEPIRKKWRVPSNQPVIMIMMGSEGSCQQKLYEIIAKLQNGLLLPPLQVFIICGRNAEMHKEVQKRIASHTFPINFRSFGWVEGKEISDFYNLAHLYIGKVGGVTTAELIHMGLPALAFAEYEPEENNLQHLIDFTLAERLDLPNLIDQILAALSRPKPTISAPLNWKSQLDTLLPPADAKN